MFGPWALAPLVQAEPYFVSGPVVLGGGSDLNVIPNSAFESGRADKQRALRGHHSGAPAQRKR
jgi:hypothetical protein